MNMEKLAELSGWDLQDELAASAKGGGRSAEDAAEARRRALETAEIIARPFRTPEGQASLATLVDLVRDRPFVRLPVEAFTAEQQALYAAMRQGQMQILNMIRNALVARDPAAKKLES